MCVHFSFLTFFPTANIVFFLLNKDFFPLYFHLFMYKKQNTTHKKLPKMVIFLTKSEIWNKTKEKQTFRLMKIVYNFAPHNN